MKKLLAAIVLTTGLATAPLAPASAGEITTQTLGYTFALALAGTAAGALLLPSAIPVAAPVVAGAYTATATTVNGAMNALGSLMLAEPRTTGAVIGMTAGFLTGLYAFSE